MTKAQETVEAINAANSAAYDNLRKLGDLHMTTWNSLMQQQMAVMNSVVDTAVAQVKLYGDSKDYAEMFNGQVELNRKLAEEMVEKSRATVELAQQAGEAYRGWAEETVSQVNDQVSKAAQQAA